MLPRRPGRGGKGGGRAAGERQGESEGRKRRVGRAPGSPTPHLPGLPRPPPPEAESRVAAGGGERGRVRGRARPPAVRAPPPRRPHGRGQGWRGQVSGGGRGRSPAVQVSRKDSETVGLGARVALPGAARPPADGRGPCGPALGSTGWLWGTGWTAPNAMGSLSAPAATRSRGILWRQSLGTILANAYIAFQLFSPLSLFFLSLVFGFVFVKEELLLLGKERVTLPFSSRIWQLTPSRNVTTCSELRDSEIIVACM